MLCSRGRITYGGCFVAGKRNSSQAKLPAITATGVKVAYAGENAYLVTHNSRQLRAA
jgi:hypothetical protein